MCLFRQDTDNFIVKSIFLILLYGTENNRISLKGIGLLQGKQPRVRGLTVIYMSGR